MHFLHEYETSYDVVPIRRSPALDRRRARRAPTALIARFETLEAARLLSFASPFASPANPGSFGLSSSNTVDVPAQSGDNLIHNFYAVLANDAGLPTATINSSQLNAGGQTVHADFTGNILGPTGFNFDFHMKEIDFYVNGSLVSPISSTITQGATVGTRQSADFTDSIALPAGEGTDSINFVLRDLAQGYATPQIHIFDITVDTVGPTIVSVGPVAPTPRTTPVSSIPVVLSQSIDSSTFTTNDLSLTRDGSAVSLAGVSVSGSGASYSVDGLSAATTTPGAYVLTVDASGIKDASGNSGTGSLSTSFTVQPPPQVATHLVVTSQPPSSIGVGVPFGLAVAAEDDSNAVVGTYSGSVVLTLASNPAGAALGGTKTATIVNGVATFSGLTVNQAGTGDTIMATSGSLKAVTSNGFNVAATGSVNVVVDNSGSNYSETGPWTTVTARGGYNADYRFAAAGDGTTTATWQVPGLTAGTYDVQASWTAFANRASNAHYRIYDGTTLLKNVSVSQLFAPVGAAVGGTTFQDLGPVSIASGTLRVVLSNDADGFVIADAVRVLSTPASPALVDDSESGYTETAGWTAVPGRGGYDGDYLYAAPGNGSVAATWQVPGLSSGTYDVQVTWVPFANRADNAHYRIYDGATLLKDVYINQQSPPSGPVVGGTTFQDLGPFAIGSGSLRVVLSNDADGYVVADAVRVVAASPPPALVDNGEAGYTETSGWTAVPGRGGYDGDYLYAAPGNGSVAATWQVPGLSSGTYDVQVTWVPFANRADNAHYQIFDGTTLLRNVYVNQQLAPSGLSVGGTTFQDLGPFAIESGSLRVVLSNDANGFVVADAVRIVATPTAPSVIDNNEVGFAETGNWTSLVNRGGYDGDYHFAAAGDGTTTATWQASGLTPGVYAVQTTWVPFANRATNAHFRIYDGNTLVSDVRVNQQLSPSGPTAGGVVFQGLGTVSVASGTLRVVLSNDANGFVIADAIRLVPVP